MSNEKTTVIYHSADFDGIFCREIARKFLPHAELIGWDYKDDKLPFPSEGTVYVLDLSPECFADMPYGYGQRLIWIDHHKSAIEKFGTTIPGYRIDGVAACRLAWQWFKSMPEHATPNFAGRGVGETLPRKQDFIDRTVEEPLAVRLAGEYDVWDKRDPSVDAFQLGLRSRELNATDWALLLQSEAYTGAQCVELRDELVGIGCVIQRYVNARDAEIVKAVGFLVDFEGLKFLALNTAGKGSLQFAARDVPETGHDALCKFNYTGRDWEVTLYHARHRTDLDLSQIAVKYGGGGHRGACGFRLSSLTFFYTSILDHSKTTIQ